MPSREDEQRSMGRVLEALEQGKEDRKEIRKALEDVVTEVFKLREIIMDLRRSAEDHQRRTLLLEQSVSELSNLEDRVGDLANRVQVQESFVKVTTTWTLRGLIAVLFGIAFGSAVFSKALDIIFSWKP